jgi:K(+)-stimulated pyrophosphate-energized sodium pump
MDILTAAILTGLSAMAAIAYLAFSILKEPVGEEEMLRIAESIEEGAKAFLYRQYRTILLLSLLLSALLAILRDPRYVAAFLSGVFLSLMSAYIGMAVAVRANVRTAYAALSSPSKAFAIAFRGGGVMGLSVTGLSLLGVSALLRLFGDPMPLVAFGFGASLSALFAQLGGGIFTKAADIGADLVGKIERKIPEDDPRNPAVIADQVGDNVGDCAGRGSDLFESISDDYVTAMLMGSLLLHHLGGNAALFPIALGAVGVSSTIIGILIARRWRNVSPINSFNISLMATVALCSIGALLSTILLLGDLRVFYAVLSGMAAMLVIGLASQYYLGLERSPVLNVARSSQYGSAINIITGLSYALQSPFIPTLLVLMSILFSYYITGGSLYGIVGANLGTDLATGIIMSGDAFGPISDNAAGIAEMTGTSGRTLEVLSELDSMGNTTKAYTKAFAAASGTFSAVVILSTFNEITGVRFEYPQVGPYHVVGVLLGGILPFLFSSYAIGATARTAYRVVEEVRRQFKEHPGILDRRERPNYKRCVDIATRYSLSQMVLPGLLALAAPVMVGLILGKYALSAMLLGGLASSSILSTFFTFGGGLWDNAKKHIEREFWMKGTPTHEAAVTGDTVGDPLKDVAGPSLNIFMKLMNMTALLIAPMLIH